MNSVHLTSKYEGRRLTTKPFLSPICCSALVRTAEVWKNVDNAEASLIMVLTSEADEGTLEKAKSA